MQTRLAASIALLSLASTAWGPPRAAAEGEKTYDLSRRDRWQVGDVRTRTGKRVEKSKVKKTNEDGTVAQDDDTSKTTTFTLIEECLEANGEGHALKWRVFVREWELKSGEESDQGLKGAFVMASGRGKDRAYRIEPADLRPSPDARRWLEVSFGARGTNAEALLGALAATTPVAIGQSWTPEVGGLVEAIGGGMPIDREKVVCTAKLLAVEIGVARRSFEITLPLTGLPANSGAVLPWTKAGAFHITGEGTLALKGRLANSTSSGRQRLAGTAASNGGTTEVDIDTATDLTTEIGGEMPKPPESPKTSDAPPK